MSASADEAMALIWHDDARLGSKKCLGALKAASAMSGDKRQDQRAMPGVKAVARRELKPEEGGKKAAPWAPP